MSKKNIFSTVGQQNDDMLQEIPADKNNMADKPDYVEYGLLQSRMNRGDKNALKINLNRLCQHFREEVATDNEAQAREKIPYHIKMKGLIERNKNIEKETEEIRNVKKENLFLRIEETRKRMAEIRANPKLVTTETFNLAGFIIGSIILLFLTFYLGLFYSSTSYSAFFRNFDPSAMGLTQAMFDAQAFNHAWRDGIMELLLIAVMPFTFLALGYLIHMFVRKRNWSGYGKAAALLVSTFAFDGLLAYNITQKIYNVHALGSFQDMPPYRLSMALTDPDFWLIIFAGFFVYLIWGLVFDFWMEAYEKRNKVTQAIKEQERMIADMEKEIAGCDAEMEKLRIEYSKNKEDISKLQSIIDIPIINVTEFQRRLYEFLSGWVEWMAFKRMPQDEIKEAHSITEEFLNNYKSQLIDIAA